MQREVLHLCHFYPLSLHTMTQKQGSICLEINSIDCAVCVGAGVFNSSPSSAFCFPSREPCSLKASMWKASHSSQCNPNLEKSNENVKRCPSGTGKSLPLASSSAPCRTVYTCKFVVVFYCLEWLICLIFFYLTSSAKPQNRLFFSGKDVWQ